MDSKKWYTSKTIWVNAITLIALLLQENIGLQLTSEETAGILTLVNLALRILTKQPLS